MHSPKFSLTYFTIALLVFAFSSITYSQTCTAPPLGLVSAYSGDGNALDPRSRNNGTIQNNVTYAAGNVGQAFQLGGVGNNANSGDRVLVGTAQNLRLQTFTFEAWIKRSSAAILTNSPFPGFPNGTIFASGASGWGILIDQPTNRLAFTKANVDQINSNFTITDTNWHHIAVTISGSQAIFYLDGVADTPVAYSSVFSFTAGAAIGARGDTDARNAFFGAIDELAIYNRVLSASDIAAIFNAGTIGKCKPLATYAPENQVLWLAGDGDANDLSGNGNNGTLQAGASYSFGKVGHGFQFNPSSGVLTGGGFVTVPDAPSLNPTGQISVEGWVYPTTDTIFPSLMAMIINKETNSTVQYEMARRISTGNCPTGGGIPTGNFAIYIGGLSGLPDDCGGWVNGNAPLPLNTWSHVAMTYDGANLRAFVNGVNTRTVAATGAISTTNGLLRLGKRVMDADVWGGQMDEMSIYSRGLTAAEIESIANAGLAGKYKVQSTVPTGLVAWFAGDGNANDISGNGNNATLAGGANSPTFTSAYVGQGFNHTGLQYATVPDSAAFRPQSVTVEGWARSNSTNTQVILSKTLGAGTFDSFGVYYTGGTVRGLVCNGTGCVEIGAPFSLNVWHHVAFSYDDPGGAAAKTARLYVDGVLVASNATGGAIGYDTHPVVIGADIENGPFQFGWSGNIDEISLYNRALPASEIRDQFYAGSGGRYKGAINPTVSNKTKTGEATVTFGTITTAGAVHLTPLNPALLPTVPTGINSGLNFDVSTNAVYADPTVCFNVSALTPVQFATLRVFHLESGAWQDRTDNSSVYPSLCSSGLTSLSPFAIAFAGPSAAGVAISGRVATADGRGIRSVSVSLIDQSGNVRKALTGAFGYYRFDEIEAGQTVVLSVSAKRYVFANPTRVISVQGEFVDVDFVAEINGLEKINRDFAKGMEKLYEQSKINK